MKLEDEIIAVHEQSSGMISVAIKMLRAKNYRICPIRIKNNWEKAGKNSLSPEKFLEQKIEKYYQDEKCKKDPALIAREISLLMKPYYSVQFETVRKYMRKMGLSYPGCNEHGGARNVGSKITATIREIEKKKKKEIRERYRFDILPEAI